MFRPGNGPDGEGAQGALACSAVTSNVLTWEEVKILSMWEKTTAIINTTYIHMVNTFIVLCCNLVCWSDTKRNTIEKKTSIIVWFPPYIIC